MRITKIQQNFNTNNTRTNSENINKGLNKIDKWDKQMFVCFAAPVAVPCFSSIIPKMKQIEKLPKKIGYVTGAILLTTIISAALTGIAKFCKE